jgi:hypothetical protein
MVEPFLIKRKHFAPFALTVCAIIASSGCSVPWPGAVYGRAETLKNPFTREAPVTPGEIAPKTEEAALADVFDQLQAIGEIDPLARERLTSDLRSVKPEHWPMMVQQFKSALAYRKQLAERESSGAKTQAMGAPYAGDQHRSAFEPHVDATDDSPAVVVSDVEPAVDAALEKVLAQVAQPLPPPPIQRENVSAVAMAKDTAVQPASYVSAALPPSSEWRDDLESAVSKLEESVNPNPGSTDEVHEQMRLRMLYLLAGRQADAMLPISGAAPAQQDYWAKQLFAMSSFLDNHQQPDDKRRAAGSLMHLDQARAKLAELATLQIRNLTFVDSVDSYGVFERRKTREFRPGDPVTLYAEVENFRSDSTKEGYRTALATSYEVVDANGQRVDGRQFPEVEDVCQNQRRDFHMQYGVALPTRIYPGEYQLRLIVTDQLSHKIGQASVPFVIVE